MATFDPLLNLNESSRACSVAFLWLTRVSDFSYGEGLINANMASTWAAKLALATWDASKFELITKESKPLVSTTYWSLVWL